MSQEVETTTQRKVYEPPRVKSERVPRLPLVELQSGFVTGGGDFRRGPPGSPEEQEGM